ncbi:hypothetical protein [Vibrio sp. SCSIO 43137]|uniref:hypothetical protein n=1 Tax=Vibrio sp. SCSIO 43137 TaxID=3021011 RepID=UPI0023075E41|nr:hypothetical protein [Vibrio sp. SCSIO 43137]WCE31100.1 hypothetical protein PK654_07500 [Vibrio sp. SCSIO 43137]
MKSSKEFREYYAQQKVSSELGNIIGIIHNTEDLAEELGSERLARDINLLISGLLITRDATREQSLVFRLQSKKLRAKIRALKKRIPKQDEAPEVLTVDGADSSLVGGDA